MSAPRRLLPLVAVVSILLSGCEGSQSALQPHGTAALELSKLIWLMILICGIVWLLVVLVLAAGLFRAPDQLRRPGTGNRKTMTWLVTGAAIATAVIIAGLTLASFYTTRAISAAPTPDLTVTVRGQQFWWQLFYRQKGGKVDFETANELHIPVGQTVRLELESPDVIHSFWVPALAGKQDLIPGRQNSITIRAERAGVYRGQCAEFCGMQHSHMSIYVIAESEAAFQRWTDAQREPAPAPTEASLIAGRDIFLSKPCSGCHTIRGTPAAGKTGPDLTHVGGRQTIAAALMENTRGTMAAWIADPQTIKPGNNMPLVPLGSEELRQLSAYLESLK